MRKRSVSLTDLFKSIQLEIVAPEPISGLLIPRSIRCSLNVTLCFPPDWAFQHRLWLLSLLAVIISPSKLFSWNLFEYASPLHSPWFCQVQPGEARVCGGGRGLTSLHSSGNLEQGGIWGSGRETTLPSTPPFLPSFLWFSPSPSLSFLRKYPFLLSVHFWPKCVRYPQKQIYSTLQPRR